MLSFPVVSPTSCTLGYEATHTLDLPNGNRTTDVEINAISFREQAIVITKDADFVTTFTIDRKPYKLLLLSTGNIKNAELENLIAQNISDIVTAFKVHNFIELNREMLVIHS